MPQKGALLKGLKCPYCDAQLETSDGYITMGSGNQVEVFVAQCPEGCMDWADAWENDLVARIQMECYERRKG